MTYPIPNYTRIWVRGRIIDVLKAAREQDSYGVTGPVQFIPQIRSATNDDLGQILSFRPFVVQPNSTTGYFAVQLPATNDPDINPVDFSYEVILPEGTRYLIKVPYDTPDLYSPGDPLHGEQVLELSNVVPDPLNPSGRVQLLVGKPGRSIESVTVDSRYHLVGVYDDGKPFDAGLVPGVYKVNNHEGPEVTLSKGDVGLNNVNNTADLNKPVSNATQAALDTKANSSDVTTALAGKANTNHSHSIGNVSGLQTALDSKAASSHSHAIGDVTGLQGALDEKAPTHSHPYEAAGAVSGHVAAADPHTQYLNNSRGDARYQTLTGIAKNGLNPIRLVGRKATAGAPTTGTWALGDAVVDSNGRTWVCTNASGSGTWG